MKSPPPPGASCVCHPIEVASKAWARLDRSLLIPISESVGVWSAVATALVPMPLAPVFFGACASISPSRLSARMRISAAI